jgi:hypothetical protein
MTKLADESAYFALINFTLVNKVPREIILSIGLLFAGLGILSPLAEGRQCGHETANLTLLRIGQFCGTPPLCYFERSKVCPRADKPCGVEKPAFPPVQQQVLRLRSAVPGTDDGTPPGMTDFVRYRYILQTSQASTTPLHDQPEADSKIQPLEKRLPRSQTPDFNRDIYYKNKLEFSLDAGWLPINIPFPFNVFEGDPYDLYPLRYTLVPIIASLRWHMDDIGSRWILRGNWDLTCSASATAIPRGAETHYFSYDMGIRRNFVPRNSRVAPYVDIRLGLGLIDAKGPLGVYFAQGQNYTFTANMGGGVRYNFNPRYAISAGLNWMHISNNNLSAPQYSNYGINVYGPMFGIDIQLRRHSRHSGL